MGRFLLSFLMLAIASSCAMNNLKPVSEMTDQELTKHVILESGGEKGLRSTETQIQAGKNQIALSPAGKTEEGKVKLMVYSSMEKAFAYKKIYKPIFKTIHKNLTKAEKIEVLNFYRSDAGRTAMALEASMDHPQVQQQFQYWVQQVNEGKEKLNEDVLTFARTVTQKTHAIDLAVESISAMSIGTLVGINSTLPKEKKSSPKELGKQALLVKEKIKEQMEPVIILTMYFTYFRLPQEHKTAMLSYFETSGGMKFHKIYAKAFVHSFSVAGKNVGKYIGRQVASMPKKKNKKSKKKSKK